MENLNILCLLFAGIIAILPFQVQATNFSQEYLGVWFSPHVSRYAPTNSYSMPHLMTMTEKISTKFSKVMMPQFSLHDYDTFLPEIPIAVATFNQLHKPASQPPLELIMLFRREFFDATKEIADKANSLFPNTVQTLLYIPPTLNIDTVSEVVEQLSAFKAEISGNRTLFQYNLGVYTPIENCGPPNTQLPPLLSPIVPQVDALFFSRFPTFSWNYEYAHGATYSANKLIKLAKACKAKLLQANRNLTVGFRTHWPDTGKDSVQNVTEFKLFWELLNDFAKDTNTTVIPSEAFDNPSKGGQQVGYDTLGWWRLVEHAPVTNASEYVFEEKRVGAAQPLPSTNVTSSTLRNPDAPTTLEPASGHISSPPGLDILPLVLLVLGATTFLIIVGAVGALLVYKFMPRRGTPPIMAVLTKEEIQNFFIGVTCLQTDGGQPSQTPCEYPEEQKIEKLAYDKRLECKLSMIRIYNDDVRGSGNFGVVVRGELNKGSEVVPVAVKMTKSSCPKTALKGLLSEIKIMSHVADHNNILKIMGAYTAELSSGKVYVFTELCNLGSLEKYLLKLKADCSLAESAEKCSNTASFYTNTSTLPHFLQDLELWSYQIACGMEYLASKHIVHADLATRNVLLTDSKTAKISDFGLSRRLYDYADYVKKQQEPLPWRWMSPEALSRLVFCEKSDVWAYGITLWEMYSLGDIPYAGQSWTVDWVSTLEEQGVRLKKPKWSDLTMYHIMTQCWETDSKMRPTFGNLKLQLASELQLQVGATTERYANIV